MAKAKVKPHHVELLMQYITRNHGVVMVSECARLYSQDVVDAVIESKKVQRTVIVAHDKDNLLPAQRINAIFTSEWKRERPIWLDIHLAKLRATMGVHKAT